MLKRANHRPRTIFGLWSTVLVSASLPPWQATAHWQPGFTYSDLLSGDRRRRCFGPRCSCHDSGSHSWGRLSCRIADRRGLSFCSLSRAVGNFLMLLLDLGLRWCIRGKPRHLTVNPLVPRVIHALLRRALNCELNSTIAFGPEPHLCINRPAIPAAPHGAFPQFRLRPSLILLHSFDRWVRLFMTHL